MELKTFVEETLVQIVQGVRAAQKNPESKGAKINPTYNMRPGQDLLVKSMYDKSDLKIAHTVEFDVAVTAEEGKGTKGGVGIMIGTIGIGSQGQSDAKHVYANRIKFNVPVLLPSDS